MRLRLALITASTRFDRLAIIRSIISVDKFSIDFKTRAENSLNVPDVILLANASLSRLFFTKWNVFSIGFRSGDRAGILRNFASMFYIAFRAALLVCDGSLSMRNEETTVLFRSTLAKKMLKWCLTKFSKNRPFILCYGTLRTTPFPFNKLWSTSHAISFHQLILSILSL